LCPLEAGEASLYEAAVGRDHDGLTTLLRRIARAGGAASDRVASIVSLQRTAL
jgi:hypothetical protein